MFCSNDNIYKIHILDYQFWIPNTCNHNAQRRTTMQQVIIASAHNLWVKKVKRGDRVDRQINKGGLELEHCLHM